MMDFSENIQAYLDAECRMLQSLDIPAINAAINAIVDARDRGAVIYTMGNGGR